MYQSTPGIMLIQNMLSYATVYKKRKALYISRDNRHVGGLVALEAI